MAKNGSNGKWIGGTARAAGGSRHFKLWIPGTPPPTLPETLKEGRPWPLVMLLHGCTLDAKQMAEISGMNEVANANQFLVVYPEQSRSANLMKCWRWFHPKHQMRGAGEPAILAAVIDEVCSNHNVDRERIYVAGISAGGAMAAIMAATYPDIFAAVAVCSGTEYKAASSLSEGLAAMKHGGPDPGRQGELAFEAMKTGRASRDQRRMPIIVFHGTADTRVNPINAEQAIAQWGKTNACLAADHQETGFVLAEKVIERSASDKVPDGYAYKRYIYVEADDRLLMEKWLIQELGHAWSGSANLSAHGDPKGPNASAEIWRFFCEASSQR